MGKLFWPRIASKGAAALYLPTFAQELSCRFDKALHVTRDRHRRRYSQYKPARIMQPHIEYSNASSKTALLQRVRQHVAW